MTHYYLCLDFEATCIENGNSDYIHEIIEFPVVLIDATSLEIIDQFHSFVKPEWNPILSSFCTQLTGITQEVVDKAPNFKKVLKSYEKWLSKYSHYPFKNILYITDGSSDFKVFLKYQCRLSNISIPIHMRRFQCCKSAFRKRKGRGNWKIQSMLNKIGLQHEGRLHSGIDDATNIARIWIHLITDGYTHKNQMSEIKHKSIKEKSIVFPVDGIHKVKEQIKESKESLNQVLLITVACIGMLLFAFASISGVTIEGVEGGVNGR